MKVTPNGSRMCGRLRAGLPERRLEVTTNLRVARKPPLASHIRTVVGFLLPRSRVTDGWSLRIGIV